MSQPVTAGTPEQSIELKAGASLADLLRSLHVVTGRLVVSELPRVSRSLTNTAGPVAVSAGLEQLSSTFQLQVVSHGNAYVIHRRYLDPREDHGLSVDDLRKTAEDISNLVRPVSPYRIDTSVITDKSSFIQSISPDQFRLLRGGALPIAQLRPDQRMLWSKINTTQGYADTELLGSRAAKVLEVWSRCRLKREVSDGKSMLTLIYPGGGAARDEDVPLKQINEADSLKVENRSKPTRPAYLQLTTGPAPLPASFRRRLPKLDGSVKLGDLMAQIAKSTETVITVPAQARNRAVMLFAREPEAGDVMHGIEDLYGWSLYHTVENRYYFGRARISPAGDAIDFHRKIRAAIPPQIHLLWSTEGMSTWERRQTFRLIDVATSCKSRFGMNWRNVAVRDLDPAVQNELCAAVFERIMGGVLSAYTRHPEAPGWLVSPDRGVFKLSKSSHGEKHPLLKFLVAGPDNRFDGWGWIVGTSSLDK